MESWVHGAVALGNVSVKAKGYGDIGEEDWECGGRVSQGRGHEGPGVALLRFEPLFNVKFFILGLRKIDSSPKEISFKQGRNAWSIQGGRRWPQAITPETAKRVFQGWPPASRRRVRHSRTW
jgi:hypothetical protein